LVLQLFGGIIGLMVVGTVAKQGMKITENMFKIPKINFK
jgi:hypothetical protein